MKTELEKLKYPVGKFTAEEDYNLAQIEGFIDTIRQFPALLRTEVENLTPTELETSYRPQGWSIRQVVHHCADSHMNAILRFKLTLTENNPTIKPYDEAAFAKLKDYQLPINFTLNVIEGLHQHWIYLLSSMEPQDFERTYYHPEHEASFDLYLALATYAWHCRHHLAHVMQAKAKI